MQHSTLPPRLSRDTFITHRNDTRKGVIFSMQLGRNSTAWSVFLIRKYWTGWLGVDMQFSLMSTG